MEVGCVECVVEGAEVPEIMAQSSSFANGSTRNAGCAEAAAEAEAVAEGGGGRGGS